MTLGAISPPTRKILAEIEERFDLTSVRGKYDAPENRTGRALDIESGDGDKVADYIVANRERFGLTRLVWKGYQIDGRGRMISGPRSGTLHVFFDGRKIKGDPPTMIPAHDWGEDDPADAVQEEAEDDGGDDAEQ